MKILVTGGNGFVGTAFVQLALQKGCQVRLAQRAMNNTLPAAAEICIVGEIGPDTIWEKALDGCDMVVHLAARVHKMNESAADPAAEYWRTNVDGTLNLARQAIAAGVKRFLFMSSIKVNGEGRETPYSEVDTPVPEDLYAQSKWEAEQQLKNVVSTSNMRLIVLRPPLVYGPGVGANFLKLITLVMSGIPLPLGSVKNARSLIYVGNLADAMYTCLVCDLGQINTFLVSDKDDVSTPKLVRILAEALERPVRTVPFPEMLLRCLGALAGKLKQVERLIGSLTIDSRQIQEKLNWSPPYTLSEGVKYTVKWYLATHKPPNR